MARRPAAVNPWDSLDKAPQGRRIFLIRHARACHLEVDGSDFRHGTSFAVVMPGLVPGIPTLQAINEKDVDGIAIRALPDRVLFLMPEVGNIRLPVSSPAMTKES